MNTSENRVWNAKTYAKSPRRLYSKPAGRRLQLSGQWLTQAGFHPGECYSVRPMSAGVRIEASQFGGTVTESHGEAKLYVPAELFANTTIEVLQVAPGKLLVREERPR